VDEEVFNMSVREFLKELGVTAQREIELAVREQLEGGELQGDETLEATATVTVAGVSRDVVATGKISSPSAWPRTISARRSRSRPAGTRRSSRSAG
jgi:hypothetical protein